MGMEVSLVLVHSFHTIIRAKLHRFLHHSILIWVLIVRRISVNFY